ncbi:MAG: Laminin sub domain 2, partial [Thermoleophilia bacterium]|nr:Laminin sub domain 2 [Thermoleophilia bacterium]
MALGASFTSSRILATIGILLAAGALMLASMLGTDRQSATAALPELTSSISLDAQAPLVATLRDRMPAGLEGRLVAPASQTATDTAWAQLPMTLDGRVRLGQPGPTGQIGNAGWSMLDVPKLERVAVAGGAAYLGSEWDVLQMVDADRLREYVVVNERQGAKTWRWQLHAVDAQTKPKLLPSGQVDLGGGYLLEPPKLLGAQLQQLDQPVEWVLRGDVLTLSFDDANLPLPYVIDPDATPPDANFVNWTESSPHAHYDNTLDVDRLWFNPNFAGSAVAKVSANDAESGVQHVTWPTPPAGWSPPGSNDSSSMDEPGIVGSYFDSGRTFTGTPVVRIDPSINYNWNASTLPYAGFNVSHSFSVRWDGRLLPPTSGTYFLQMRQDIEMRVWIDLDDNGTFGAGELVLGRNNNTTQTETSCFPGINLNSAIPYRIRVEMEEDGGGAIAILRWKTPSDVFSTTPGGATACHQAADESYAGAAGAPWVGSTYPVIPASAYTLGGGLFTRSYSWGVGAADGIVNASATNGDGAVTGTIPVEFRADGTPPVVSTGTVAIDDTGWTDDSTPNVTFPNAANISDAGIGLHPTAARQLQRRIGSGGGDGTCGGYGPWTDVGGVNPADGPLASPGGALTSGQCAEYRYVVQDRLENKLFLVAPGFRGYDANVPTITFNSYANGAGSTFQHDIGNRMWINTATGAGDFDVTLTATDTQSGMAFVRFPAVAPGLNWTPSADSDVVGPGPAYTKRYAWTMGADEPDYESPVAFDSVDRFTTGTNRFRISVDNTSPIGGVLEYSDGWAGMSELVKVTSDMTDANSGVRSRQLQRDTAPLVGPGLVCGTWSDAWVDVGPKVLGPAPLPDYSDGALLFDTCHRYRIETIDNVSNVGHVTGTTSIKVDASNPTATISPLAATIDGSTPLAIDGTSIDDRAGVVQVTLRFVQVTGTPGYAPADIVLNNGSATPTWSTSLSTAEMAAMPSGEWSVV